MIEIVITAMCLQLNTVPDASKYYTSCVSATTATAIQTKVTPTLDEIQHLLEEKVKKQTGEAIWWTVGMIYGFQQKGTMTFNIPVKPYIDNIGLQGNVSGPSNLNFTWYW